MGWFFLRLRRKPWFVFFPPLSFIFEIMHLFAWSSPLFCYTLKGDQTVNESINSCVSIPFKVIVTTK